jgi:hypothetical protein
MPDITQTLLTSAYDPANHIVYNTASISPGADKLILAFISGADNFQNENMTVVSVTGAGLTWVKIAEVQYQKSAGDGTERSVLAVFRALDPSPSTGGLAITFSSGASDGLWAIVEFDNMDTSGTDGSGAIVQVETNVADSVTSLAATLAIFGDPANAAVGGFGVHGNVNFTPGSGFTEIVEEPGGLSLQAQFRVDPPIPPTIDASHNGAAAAMAVIGIEIRNATPAPPTEIVGTDTIDLATDPETSTIDVAKAAADTAGLTIDEGLAERLEQPGGILTGFDAVALGDFAEFGSVIPFVAVENDPGDAIVLTGEALPSFIEGPVSVAKTLIIAEIKLTGGTLYRAAKGIRHPTRMYVGKVKSFGSIIRSIQVPSGLAQIGDAELTIVDTDGELRRLMSETPPQNREVVIKIGGEGESEAIFQIAYTGTIVHATFPPGLAKLRVSDNTFKFLQEKLPDLLTRENFTPDPVFARNIRQRTEGRFDETEIFSPIVFGILDSTGLDVTGSMNAVRLDSTTFNLAQHPIPHGPIRIFIKDPDARPEPDQSFIEQVGGFSIVEVAKTIDGIDYIFTHVVFGTGQADGFEVRWDGEGMTDTGDQFGTPVRNPAEAILLYLTRIAGRDPGTELDLIGFDFAGEIMAEVATGGPAPGFFCDGAITQRMNHREALARMTRSFGIFLFTNKDGRITIRYIAGSNPDRTILDDVQDIYVRSETHSLARPIINEVKLQYIRMFSEQSWQGLLNVRDDAAVDSLQRVESKDLKLFFVRDDFVADRVARDFLQFSNPGSFRIVMTIPGHRRTADVELAELIGVTNYSGLDPSGRGYENREFLIQKTEFRTDSKELRVFAVARVEPPVLGLTNSTSLEFFFPVVAADGLFENGFWLELTGRPPLGGQEPVTGFPNPVVLPFTPKWITIEVANGFGGFPGVPVPTIGILDFGRGVPGQVEPVLEGIAIITDQQGVDGRSSRQYSFPYEGWQKDDRVFVRARDNQDGPAESAPQTHDWLGDLTFWS